MAGFSVPQTGSSSAGDNRGAWLSLAILTSIYTLNIADRFIVSTLMEPIKREFGLSDTMVGLLTGTVLAIFFVLATFPAGVLTDRVNRKHLLAGCTVLFSIMTAACGFAKGVTSFAVARVGVGVAEAGTTPPSLSLLADKFTPQRRAMAMTTFTVGAALGGALGSIAGGWISDHYGWRMTLIVFGFAGIPLLLLLLLFVHEPKRGALDPVAHAEKAGIRETAAFIWQQKSLVHVIAGGGIVSLWGWGLLWWAPAFYRRSFGLSVGEVGEMLGAIHLVAGSGAIIATAFIMKAMAGRDPRSQLLFIAGMVGIATIPSMIAVWTHSLYLSVAMSWIYIPVVYLYFGPNFAMVNNLVPASMRGQAVAIYLISANFTNLAIAPQVVGFASDWFAHSGYGEADGLRYALIGLSFCGFWGMAHFLAALRTFRSDLQRALSGDEEISAMEGAAAAASPA